MSVAADLKEVHRVRTRGVIVSLPIAVSGFRISDRRSMSNSLSPQDGGFDLRRPYMRRICGNKLIYFGD